MARPRSEVARQKVLDAAFTLIADVGLAGLTIDAVSKRSGVAKSTIYRNFEDGDKLLFAAIGSVVEPMPTPNTGSLRGDLIALHERFCTIMDDQSMRRLMLGVMGRAMIDEKFRRLKEAFQEERHQPIKTVIELAKARGELAEDLDVDFAMTMIEGPFAARYMFLGDPLQVDEVPAFVDAILDGLRPR